MHEGAAQTRLTGSLVVWPIFRVPLALAVSPLRSGHQRCNPARGWHVIKQGKLWLALQGHVSILTETLLQFVAAANQQSMRQL